MAGAPFAPALAPTGEDDFERILRHLGRNPEWDSRVGESARTLSNVRVVRNVT